MPNKEKKMPDWLQEKIKKELKEEQEESRNREPKSSSLWLKILAILFFAAIILGLLSQAYRFFQG